MMNALIETLNGCGACFVPLAYAMLLQSTLLILIVAAIDFLLLRRANVAPARAFANDATL